MYRPLDLNADGTRRTTSQTDELRHCLHKVGRSGPAFSIALRVSRWDFRTDNPFEHLSTRAVYFGTLPNGQDAYLDELGYVFGMIDLSDDDAEPQHPNRTQAQSQQHQWIPVPDDQLAFILETGPLRF